MSYRSGASCGPPTGGRQLISTRFYSEAIVIDEADVRADEAEREAAEARRETDEWDRERER
ncbi:hypothetical protein [Haloechinothrix salitolerans]|uniref:Uncharacterized protein n=1 Tax=Haloechinothrix salitolerans TaxID=926830 RepID=A0ABW2C4Y4_9PSEU